MRCDGWNDRLADQSRKNEVQEGNNIRNEVGRRTMLELTRYEKQITQAMRWDRWSCLLCDVGLIC